MLPEVMSEEEYSCHINILDSLTARCKSLYPTKITVIILLCYVIYQLLYDISLHHVI